VERQRLDRVPTRLFYALQRLAAAAPKARPAARQRLLLPLLAAFWFMRISCQMAGEMI
jgi:hypothetical protein